jgi:uncharacterized OB-fold protein
MSRPAEAPLGAVAITLESSAFWAGAARGKLVLPLCRTCGKSHYHPRSFCPHCFSDDLDMVEACGRGTIYTFSVMRRAEPPYAIAYVRLEEGPVMLSRIVDADFEAIVCDQPVRVAFRAAPGGEAVPVFAPDGERA